MGRCARTGVTSLTRMSLAAAAIESSPSDKQSNLQRIGRWCRTAAQHGAQLACFPAMAVTGYWETSEVMGEAEIVRPQVANPAITHPIGPSILRLEEIARESGLY